MRRLLAVFAFVNLCGCGQDSGSGSSAPDRTDADVAGDVVPDADTVDDVVPDVPDGTPDAVAPDVDDESGAPDAPADVADAPDGDTPTDAVEGDPPDAAPDGDALECPEPEPFAYTCAGADPETCPEGFCVLGQCLAPILDADRWAECGDGECGPCETACPVDCGPPLAIARPRAFDNDTTITVEVHGFNPVDGGEWEETVYGEVDDAGGMGRSIRLFAPAVPDWEDEPTATNQMVGVEYYGAIPAEWLSVEDIEEIEANDWRTDRVLHRYALIVAKFINRHMADVGATDVNIFCHSMGCHVTRYMIENDIEGVASSGVIARWSTATGVLAGARLARLFDNPFVRDAAELLWMNTADFVHMNPDYVTDHSAVWDHQLHAANNPLFEDMLIHHLVATDPTLQETFDILPLLDLSNPDDEPNDGLVYTWDELFWEQDESVRHVTPTGERVLPTASYQTVDHFEIKDTLPTGILHAAGLYHRRKVWIIARTLTLRDDLEQDSIVDVLNQGSAPADISFRARVSYDPYVTEVFGQPGFVHEQAPEDRSTPLTTLFEGQSIRLDWTVYEGPVFDAMTTVSLDFELLEMDWYPRFGVSEWAFDIHERLVEFTGDVLLSDDLVILESDAARVELEVRVREMY